MEEKKGGRVEGKLLESEADANPLASFKKQNKCRVFFFYNCKANSCLKYSNT